MSWLIIVIVAYFLNALAAVVDKYLLSKRVPQPIVYTFFISVLGLFAIFLIPFGFEIPSIFLILLSLITGISFTFALLYLFSALKDDEATKVMPFIGGLQPIFIFILSYFFLKERLNNIQLLAFIFLVLGTFFITLNFNFKKIFKDKIFLEALISTFLFALGYFLTKIIYQNHPFISSFIWIRFGSLLAAASFLVFQKSRRKLINTLKPREGRKRGTSTIFVFGQICAAFSFLLINYAIKLNSLSLINGLQGIQYIFLITIVIILSKRFPQILEERLAPKVLVQRILAIFFISLGLLFLTL